MSTKKCDQEFVSEALDEALKITIEDNLKRTIQLSTARLIFISDIHKGARDCADDFRASEKTYNAMLAYYYNLGHTLVILGDAEELWENKAKRVMDEYKHSFDLEKRFLEDDRYLRIWGNHDRLWSKRRICEKHLFKALAGGITDIPVSALPDIPQAYLLEIMDKENKLGDIFLVHGHQGSKRSDRFRWFSRLFVLIFVRPIQCWFKISWNPKSPANDSSLRKSNNVALYRWIEKQKSMILIAGHTHRPVFASESHLDQLKRELSRYDPNNEGYNQIVAEYEAEMEWAIAQEMQMPDDMHEKTMEKKCYFNTGCCCFTDGNTTGIEIFDGEIRLVHWPNRNDQPKPFIPKRESLRKILNDVSTYVQRHEI